MTGPAHRIVATNGIRLHVAEQGSGPLVLLCHGFPESWYSWRHQLPALAEAGFRAVAPDMRGYGRTDRPEAVDQYTLLHLVGDMVGLLDALGEAQAVIVGHDWGALVAWTAALLRPDRFRGTAALAVPFMPRSPERPTSRMPETEETVFYQRYLQAPGVEAEFEADVRYFIRGNLLVLSGEGPMRHRSPAAAPVMMVPRIGGLRARWAKIFPTAPTLPPWLSEADINVYAAAFAHTGFRAALNWYRNIDRNWELLAPFAGARVAVPAILVIGEHDVTLAFPGADQLLRDQKQYVPQLRRTMILPRCGHWTQQERFADVNAALIEFLRSL